MRKPVLLSALPGGGSVPVAPGSVNQQVGQFLAGTEAAPRTFQFDRLHFDTAQSRIRAEDEATLQGMGQILAAYPAAKVRIVGYADARGPDPANIRLGKERAEAVKAALVSRGVDSGRIETASGGEADPADTNATASGRQENRRTEIVVLSR